MTRMQVERTPMLISKKIKRMESWMERQSRQLYLMREEVKLLKLAAHNAEKTGCKTAGHQIDIWELLENQNIG